MQSKFFESVVETVVASVAASVVSSAIERFGELLRDEPDNLFEVREHVEWLQTELKRMQSFLKDADANQHRNERVRNLVSEIQDLAYKAEDAIDTFILKKEEKPETRNPLMALFPTKKRKISNEQMIVDIEGIRTNIKNISESIVTYGITNVGGGGGEGTSSANKMLRLVRHPNPDGDEEDIVVGFEDDVKTLVAQLVNKEPRRRVISIVGMGGLGKTTLARKLYNSSDVKRHFPSLCAWVYVSQEYKITDVLQRIIKSFRNPSREELEMMDRMTEEDLERKLYVLLGEDRYLLVIDDIWETYAWESLKRALPDKRSGSRVILTTRNREIALYADESSPPHDLPFLSNEDSWKLFCKKAFRNNASASCPDHLLSLGKEMVKKCGGLPLAITVLGALMWRKEEVVYEWQRVLDHIDAHLMKDQHQIAPILALSYYDLPYQLKPCFLYVGLFPEDSEISVTQLIQLWVAEGSIPQGGETMEDVAEDYLNELIDRCMLQVARRSYDGLRVETCRIHDILRDFSISKAKEENFLHLSYEKNKICTPSPKLRRQAIHFITEESIVLSPHHSSPHLRSLLIFGNISMSHLNFKGFGLLRVLHLQKNKISAHTYSLPDSIGKLIHLRYLRLIVDRVIELPESIVNLRSLQTLDLKQVDPFGSPKIPNVIWKMTNLRNLHVRAGRAGIKDTRLRIDTLRNLCSLFEVHADVWMRNNVVNLTNLRRLEITGISCSHGEAFSVSIARLSSLRKLLLVGNTLPTLIPLTSCPCLHELTLWGRIQEPHEFPPNLTCLYLDRSGLKQDAIAKLEKLPNLRFLLLGTSSFSGKQMFCSGGGFSQLQHLHLFSVIDLEEWIVEEGAMPCLRRLKIGNCLQLKMVPEGLRFMTTLRELKILRMPMEFENRVRGGGEDFYKVRHIPSITIHA